MPPQTPSAPVTEKYSMLLEDDKCIVGASSMQGWRPTMEDAHTVYLTLPRLKNHHEDDGAIFAVFDGHCGTKCAQLCAANIVHWLCQSDSYLQGDYARGLFDAFIHGDASLRASLGRDTSGCAAIVTLIVGKMLYCASAGDSRAMICRNGEAVVLTEDHKPTLSVEKKRIELSGGFVMNGRVNGVLALSRAFGDFPLKDEALAPQHQAVTVVPSVATVELSKYDEFLVVGCDGIFEKKNNEEVVYFVRNAIRRQRELGHTADMSKVCEELMVDCLGPAHNLKGSDNMSAIVVLFKDALAGNSVMEEAALGPLLSSSPPKHQHEHVFAASAATSIATTTGGTGSATSSLASRPPVENSSQLEI
ncbi:protein phosphatase-like, putative [Bodo saltans]|uniref:Protein phosphatase-like, putative n=1 Tax=Bodo saltans TaxID=75058 RepID=A0A0S4IY95_BODSA|nr:protein phosphatase-like, putative [Bodo saltans]|eukprot:CUF97060.1 protein phosphatase-like, putative [Bodo saltans]